MTGSVMIPIDVRLELETQGDLTMETEKKAMDRREFILAGGLVGAGVAVAAVSVVKDRAPGPPQDPTGEGTVRKLAVLQKMKERQRRRPHPDAARAGSGHGQACGTTTLDHGDRYTEVYRVSVVHHRLCRGKQVAAGRCVSARDHAGVRSVSQPANPISAATVHALRPTALRSCLSRPSHLETSRRDRGHRLRQVHLVQILPQCMPVRVAHQ